MEIGMGSIWVQVRIWIWFMFRVTIWVNWLGFGNWIIEMGFWRWYFQIEMEMNWVIEKIDYERSRSFISVGASYRFFLIPFWERLRKGGLYTGPSCGSKRWKSRVLQKTVAFSVETCYGLDGRGLETWNEGSDMPWPVVTGHACKKSSKSLYCLLYRVIQNSLNCGKFF